MQLGVGDPIVLGPGEGEVVTEQPGRSSRIKAALTELLVLESRSDAGQRGAAPHIHRAHTDCFFVLEGELVFHLAGERRRAPAGSFVLAPPGLVHGFEVGENGARYLNLHAPGREYAALVRARRDGVEFDAGQGDTFDPPADGGKPAREAIVRLPDDGELLVRRNRVALVKAALPDLSVLEFEIHSEFEGPDVYVHTDHADCFYVLDGELKITVVGKTSVAGPGTFAAAPAGVEHAFAKPGRERARFLSMHAPDAGFVGRLRRMSGKTTT
jgi:quercetin dioxygenase-like cupin family protein